jgi:hypothetical protein
LRRNQLNAPIFRITTISCQQPNLAMAFESLVLAPCNRFLVPLNDFYNFRVFQRFRLRAFSLLEERC